MCGDKKKNKKSRTTERLQRAPGAVLLHRQEIRKPWYDSKDDSPEYLTVRHDAFKPHLSRELQPGQKHSVYVQPPGKEVAGGVDHAAIQETYELLMPGQPGGSPVARLDLAHVRNFMVLTKRYKAEVLDNDAIELWPTGKQDYFVMGLVKETCHVCGKETGDSSNGVAYICDACNRGVHATCAGVDRELGEDEEFKCPACKPQAPAARQKGAKADAEEDEGQGSEGAENELESPLDEEPESEDEEEEEKSEDEDVKRRGKGKGKAAAKAKGAKNATAAEPKSKRQRK